MNDVTILLGSAFLLMTPILLAALGEIVIERSGTLNIAIEGVMLSGCFAAAGMLQLKASLGVAAAVSIPFGAILGLLLAWLFVRRRVNQIVGGVMFNLLALGLTTLLFSSFFKSDSLGAVESRVAIPLLSQIPVVGKALFDQPLLCYLALVLVPLAFLLLHASWFGLHCRAAGERPEAVDTVGVSVEGVRTSALAIGCALMGLGGASIVVLQAGAFTPGMTEGVGFIALAIAMVARWNPLLAVPAAASFGLAQSFSFQAQTLGIDAVPSQVWAALPYVVTIAAVAIGHAARYPDAIAVPFTRRGSA